MTRFGNNSRRRNLLLNEVLQFVSKIGELGSQARGAKLVRT